MSSDGWKDFEKFSDGLGGYTGTKVEGEAGTSGGGSSNALAAYDNYAKLPMPTTLTLQATPTNDRAAAIAIEKQKLVTNGWNVVTAQMNTIKAQHNAHAAGYGAVNAAISAGKSYYSALTNWFGYSSQIAKAQIAQGEMNKNWALVPIKLETFKLEVQSSLLDLQQLRQDVSYKTIMLSLQGYNTSVELPESLSQDISQIFNGNTVSQTA